MFQVQSTQAEEEVKLKGQQSKLSSTLIMDFGPKHLLKRNDTIILSATSLSDAVSYHLNKGWGT